MILLSLLALLYAEIRWVNMSYMHIFLFSPTLSHAHHPLWCTAVVSASLAIIIKFITHAPARGEGGREVGGLRTDSCR